MADDDAPGVTGRESVDVADVPDEGAISDIADAVRRAPESSLTVVAAVAAVATNAATGTLHGGVHATAPVFVAPSLLVVVGITVGVFPLYGVWLLVRGSRRRGGALIAASLVIAFTVEGLAHFVVENPDHVAMVEHQRAAFATTAALSVLTDLVGVVAGAWFWVATDRP